MYVMRNARPNAKAAAKQASHERIVAVAARAIRRTGYDGTGVADIMKEAGLTHGAFYAHFASREALLAEAAGRACAESAALAADAVAEAVAHHAVALRLGVGVSSGEAIVGNIGSEERLEYTVIGDTANTASRVESATKKLKKRILITDQVKRRLNQTFPLIPVGNVMLRGKSQSIKLYEID